MTPGNRYTYIIFIDNGSPVHKLHEISFPQVAQKKKSKTLVQNVPKSTYHFLRCPEKPDLSTFCIRKLQKYLKQETSKGLMSI